ncbi:metallophosphoesterase [Intrasporangium calvum]|uniref:Metallophosphoesterase n=1 Tax=Intrasporangium calvum (strain ATCC 23552 / DSM 43043 / JCM 3097 / NBRC 12989 / NCIMB 10167 / NRRL B-3866 / 7 KIP) TaxID=710696 RepID=E6S7F2_INTC7|nr:metallophosphoesterase [Intrasporangium calvum]ADU50115.1 metallophosphoesterase [Intrasporangium calvum DSM 43043]AXG14930.1 metallophosphoesterase [Intrasporangium calvum]
MVVHGTQPAPTHVIAHLSDLHLIAGEGLLHGHIDTAAQFRKALARVEESGEGIDALVLSGDLTDVGQPEAYALLREIVAPVSERLAAPVVVTGGNHDERRALAAGLHAVDTDEPQDTVTKVNGLRILTLDSALPGFHHGGFSDAQYAWLADQLTEPAPHGTILVMHHPPITYRSPLMQLLDFEDVPRLRTALEGTDVRAILSGHLHVTSFGTLGAIPVFVAGGICYVDDAGAPRELLMAVDGPQSWNLIEVHADHVVGTVIPVERHETWPALNEAVVEYLATVAVEDQRTVFSTKR